MQGMIISQSIIDIMAAEIFNESKMLPEQNIVYTYEGEDYTLTISANLEIIEDRCGDGYTTPRENYIEHASASIVYWDCTDEDSISFKSDVKFNTKLLELEIECRLLQQAV